ncbi:hypothetical protein V8J88_19555 [Massilia sp. W12]|uniref:hypothetical protein n=1 Tax=Massilia sp. W12 TaxID=3126507 RepID=UPI0030D29D6F
MTSSTGYSTRPKKRTDYHEMESRYDEETFEYDVTVHKKPKIFNPHQAQGRTNAAPPLTAWPFTGQHASVKYYDDASKMPNFNNASGNIVQLPFAWLDISCVKTWQALTQDVSGISADPEVRQHFNAVTNKMLIPAQDSVLTECVGEAATAICMLEKFPGFEMLWGFHLHSGTGIDQIWAKDLGTGKYEFMIVEAKGPGAGLTWSAFLPPDYNQMEEGWIANHLYSMDKNGHAAGSQLVNAMRMQFSVAHANYGGGSKSYYGLSSKSQHTMAGSTVYGMVVTAQWLSDGRLGYTHTKRERLFTK